MGPGKEGVQEQGEQIAKRKDIACKIRSSVICHILAQSGGVEQDEIKCCQR